MGKYAILVVEVRKTEIFAVRTNADPKRMEEELS